MPHFSVIITTHDRPAFLGRAIRSVKAQAVASVQIITVSDCSCADTFRVASSMLGGEDFFIQRGGPPGPAESRNVGLAQATGDFVIFLDDDDALSPGFLSEAGAYLNREEVLFCDYFAGLERVEGEVSTLLGLEKKSLAGIDIDSIHSKNFIPQPCLIFPKNAVACRHFNPSLKLNEDWEFTLNVMTEYSLRHAPVEGPIVFSREATDNRGRSNNDLLEATYRKIYKDWPAPTHEHRLARQSFFATAGFAASLCDL